MVFNSIEFIIFFISVLMIYFNTKSNYKWIVLLLASYYFYMAWNPIYILLIMLSTGINYIIGILIENKREKSKRILITGILFNLGVLLIFKYFNFFVDSINWTMKTDFNVINLVLPMGISFYTFQTMSYTIDVYRKKKSAERHLGIFALYVSFFPQLVAGPIERSERLLPQFYEEHKFKYEDVTEGLKKMAIGFFKKIVIADRVAVMVNYVYNSPTERASGYLVIATLLFGIQIYCDFSGYSDIAIGAAKIMGFELMENFKRPYFSKSISEFWKRWHISLSSWFKDYLYIPLGGNRVKLRRAYLNLFITFLISGLWHGASWTFVCWGALHGIYLILGQVLKPIRNKVSKIIGLDKHIKFQNIIRIMITTALVMFAWIFFRANNMIDAIYIVKNIFGGIISILNPITAIKIYFNMGLSTIDTMISIISICVLIIISILERKKDVIKIIGEKHQIIRYCIYYGIIMYIILFAFIGNSEFIYFQF